MSRVAVLGQAAREGLAMKGTFESRPDASEGWTMWTPEKVRTARAKALRQECALGVQGTTESHVVGEEHHGR